MKKIKILVVDDHPLMREALKVSLASEDDMQVLGEAANALEAFELLETLKPDVILMDLLMPHISGEEAIAHILASDADAKVVVISSLEEEARVMAAIQAGALGYYPKAAAREVLLEAIRKAADGIPYMPSEITLKLFQGLRRMSVDRQLPLTKRQREILRLLADAKTDEEIAGLLRLQATTVRAHLYHIQQKFGVENRAQILAYAHKHKLLD